MFWSDRSDRPSQKNTYSTPALGLWILYFKHRMMPVKPNTLGNISVPEPAPSSRSRDGGLRIRVR